MPGRQPPTGETAIVSCLACDFLFSVRVEQSEGLCAAQNVSRPQTVTPLGTSCHPDSSALAFFAPRNKQQIAVRLTARTRVEVDIIARYRILSGRKRGWRPSSLSLRAAGASQTHISIRSFGAI